MRLKSAIIRGLIGVYRGSSGLKEITIDFTKCRHKLILITGPNGSGKSSVLDVLNPLPDNQNMYIEKMNCFKELEYIMDDGTLYQIHIDYPVNKYGERTTTKAFIRKIIDGNIIELNSNGNVGTYKDTIYNEFKLDANFIALTKLSSENKGLVEKTPAGRKTYVGGVLSTTEVYNNIYKTLNKRSSVFSSIKNSIVAKIDAIGNEDSIKGSLSNTEERLNVLKSKKESLIKQLSDAEAMVKISDPNGTIQTEYLELHRQNESIQHEIETLEIFLKGYKEKEYVVYVGDNEKCLESKSIIDNKINDIQNKISSKKESMTNLLVSREEEASMLQIKQNRLESLSSEYNYDELSKEINKLKTNIKTYKDILHSVGLSEDTMITKDEFISGMNLIKSINEQISVIRSYSYEEDIQQAVHYIRNNINIVNEQQTLSKEINEATDTLNSIKADIIKYTNLKSLTDVLSIRPSECKIDSCGFIKNALDALKTNPDEKLDDLGKWERGLTESIEALESKLKNLDSISKIITDINVIIRSTQSSTSILYKIPGGEDFATIENLIHTLETGKIYNFDKLYSFLDCVNILEQYRYDKEQLIKLEADFKVYESKNTLIEELSDDINSLIEKLSNLENTITESNNEIMKLETELIEMNKIKTIIDSASEKYKRLEDLQNQKIIINNRISVLDKTMVNIEVAIQNINSLNSEIKNVNNELEPLTKQTEQLRYSLNKLGEYQEELNTYSTKVALVELLKKYSSPTKDGIQNLFIEVYMGQTLKIANNLLKMMFSDLELMKYEINDKEFRIPCRSLNSDIINDDISSCSMAERCTIGTVLSVAMLQQSSPIYNILEFDEIDGGLDSDNRSKFPEFLERIMNILGIEMCMMISHASESVLDNTDIICLGAVGNELPKGNIIFTYEDEQNKRVC